LSTEDKYDFVVSTIVPALNEEGNIDELCRLFAEMLSTAPFEAELVLIDDGSTDGTLAKIVENSERYDFIRYSSHQRNRGLTAALETGFALAKGEVYIYYPADLQYVPEDIPALVRPIARGADVSAGWKQGKYSKRFVSKIYNWLSRKIFNLKVHDLNSVKAFRREIVRDIFLRRDWHRYLVVLASEQGYRVEEEKIPVYERKWGKTKFSIGRIPIGVLDMLAVKFQITFLKKPLLFFGLSGAFLLFLGFLVGLWALYMRYVEGYGDRAYLYLVILLVGMGMGLFMMGFLAEGMTALKEEMDDLRKKTGSILERITRDDDK
jgi:glycosyltransferase involved in cell wall biosynthesis